MTTGKLIYPADAVNRLKEQIEGASFKAGNETIWINHSTYLSAQPRNRDRCLVLRNIAHNSVVAAVRMSLGNSNGVSQNCFLNVDQHPL